MTDVYTNLLMNSNKMTYKELCETKIELNNDYIRNFLNIFIDKFKYTKININLLVSKITQGLPKIVSINEFLNFSADQCVVHTSHHFEYNKLGSNILIHRLHLITSDNMTIIANTLKNNVDNSNKVFPLISDDYYNALIQHEREIKNNIDYDRDYDLDYFGIKTLERSYLLRIKIYKRKWKKVIRDDIIIERPQHLFMRVACCIHCSSVHGFDINAAIETYHLISQRYFTHATPTLFNAGTPKPQLSSCFLIPFCDSMESIAKVLGDIMQISKWAGGIGSDISEIRSAGSLIKGTNGISDGIIPLCQGLNWISKYVNQGGKRNGSIKASLSVDHPDIFEFCELRKNTGSEDKKCRDLFLAVWVSDLFMQRVKNDEMWSLMCPDQSPGLNRVWGKEYIELYTSYEQNNKFVTQIKARTLMKHIIACQSETGFPYMLFKDHANAKSNQQNLGTIRSSNLCAEIMEYSDENETAVCNLASICLPKFVVDNSFDYKKLIEVVRIIVKNLNKIIDINFYPTKNTRRSNMRNRPIGIGVQGLHDVYQMLGYAWSSDEATILNKKIFETIYYAALLESNFLAKIDGPYTTFKNSPFSKGILQFHMWGLKESNLLCNYDWAKLINDIKLFGTRNSLLTALMPTASTSQIMKNCECFEPYMTNIFVRTTLAGEFIVINENLVKALEKLHLWSDDMRKLIIINNGSIQNISSIPDNIKQIYLTAFELQLKPIIKQSVERGPFIDQSQSLNLFQQEPNFTQLYNSHMYAWENGLKTGMYYLRTTSAVNPINFGIDIDDIKRLCNISDTHSIINNSFLSANKKRKIITDKKQESIQEIKEIVEIEEIAEIAEIEEETIMCKFDPSKKAEGCMSCGS